MHEKIKATVHIFEIIGKHVGSRQTDKILDNGTLKIKELKTFKERITEETMTLIKKIEELCDKCLANAEWKIKTYMNLIVKTQNPITAQDLNTLESQLKLSLSFCIPSQNFQDILKYYNQEFFGENEERVAMEIEKSKALYEKTVALEKEYRDLQAPLQNLMQQLITKKIIKQKEIDRIFNNDPKYVPKPNEIQSEVKAIYTTIRDNIRILTVTNAELLSIINSVVPSGEVATLNNDLVNNTIPQLEESIESCNSFLAFIKFISGLLTETDSYHSIKINKDRSYYLFCKVY